MFVNPSLVCQAGSQSSSSSSCSSSMEIRTIDYEFASGQKDVEMGAVRGATTQPPTSPSSRSRSSRSSSVGNRLSVTNPTSMIMRKGMHGHGHGRRGHGGHVKMTDGVDIDELAAGMSTT